MPLDNPRSDFSNWYSEILLRAKIVDIRTPIKGSNVLMPNGYEIWENIKNFMNIQFKKTNHKNAYFPLFIPEEFLEMETEHFSGFIPEVAWVTHVGDKKLNKRSLYAQHQKLSCIICMPNGFTHMQIYH